MSILSIILGITTVLGILVAVYFWRKQQQWSRAFNFVYAQMELMQQKLNLYDAIRDYGVIFNTLINGKNDPLQNEATRRQFENTRARLEPQANQLMKDIATNAQVLGLSTDDLRTKGYLVATN